MKFTALGLFKIISSALTIFPRMFECADKFIPFTPYLFVSFMIFSILTAAYIWVCHSLTNMVTPRFLDFFKWYTHIDILWKFYQNHIGTSAPNWLRYDHYAPDSQIWYRPIFALKALTYEIYSSWIIQNYFYCIDNISQDQILFSFSTDKDRRTDSRIRRKNTAQPRRESTRASLRFPRMFECPDKFIPFTPYLFIYCMIFLNFDGSLHFGLPLLNQHGDPQFFSHFFKWYTHIDICENFIKII